VKKKLAVDKNIRYVAFLRGINVGGHAPILMADLKRAFERLGFSDVRSLLASGNVVFASARADQKGLTNEIESGLKRAFKKDIRVILRGLDDLEMLRSAAPFKGIQVTPSIRLYVTFLSEKAKSRTISIPYASPQGEFRILQATSGEVFSVLDLSKGMGTPDAMNILEKEFGAEVTTRNWHTVLKAMA